MATREMSDAVIVVSSRLSIAGSGKLVNPNLEFEFRVVRQDSWHRWIPFRALLVAFSRRVAAPAPNFDIQLVTN